MPTRPIRSLILALALATGSPVMAQPLADPVLRAGMEAVRKDDETLLRAAIKAETGPVGRDVLLWHLLRARHGTFEEGEAFLARRPDWPGLDLLRERMEIDLPVTVPPDRIVAFFATEPSQTSRGALMLAISLLALNRPTEAELVAIDAWLTLSTSSATETGLLDTFGPLLRSFDAARLDAMVWAGETDSAERVLSRLSGPEAALARARIGLRRNSDGVNRLIDAVPEGFRDHPGLAYERFRWRLERGRTDDALELLFAHDESADSLGKPGVWAGHRERLARGLMQDGRPDDAYRVAANHRLPAGHEDTASLEWLAGYVALRFLERPADAAAHFRDFDAAVASPISKGRSGYWLGRALEAAGDADGAAAAYRIGAGYQSSFYGQLAAERAGLPADPRMTGQETFPPLSDTSFAGSSVLAAARLLEVNGERNLAERFLTHLAESLPREEIGTLINVVLDEMDDPHVALLVAKRAAQAGHEMYRGYFPVTKLAGIDGPVAPELTLSIARRESEFDPVVVSRAGAAGLMQVMPGTAREMAKRIGQTYNQGKLTSDPDYNARLGIAYLGLLERQFGLSPILVPAAYNAGPSRARQWLRDLGDLSASDVDVIHWIEDVPFAETRNYIMRVSESLAPYRARLSGEAGELRLGRWLKSGYGDLTP